MKTLSDYRQKLTRFVEWHDGELGGFTLAKARAFVAHLQETPKWSTHTTIQTSSQMLSAQTVRWACPCLERTVNMAPRRGYIGDNVLRRLAKPKVPSRVVEVLADDEVKKLLQSLDANTGVGARDLAILTIFLDSGLRLSELVGLRVQDIHLQQGWLKVYGKDDKERIVPFGVMATKVLSRYVTLFRPQDLETESFFVNIDGGPITQNTIKMLFVRLQQRSGVERLHPHLMRHTFATNYLMSGGDVFSLQSILGHTTFEMTRRYVTLASLHVAIQHRRFSPMDRTDSGGDTVPGYQTAAGRC